MSTRPSPLMSPAPMPCAAYVPSSPTCVESHGPAGFAGSGLAQRMAPALAYTRSGLPSPSMSFIADTSETLGAGGTTPRCESHRLGSPFGFTYNRVFDVDASRTSGQPSPVKSPANSSQFCEKLVEGLVESAM